MRISERDTEHIFERLRSGVVPERGLEAFAVGVEEKLGEMRRQLKLAEAGEGGFKFLRGGYGCGKTFMSRLTAIKAREKGFAVSYVVVSDNDLHFHKFDDVYRKTLQELSTNSCRRGALGDILDRWIARIEDGLIDAGADEDSPEFDAKVLKRMDQDLTTFTRGNAPED
ncbi:MAG: BREX system ATP-binding protein BrxD, partial [Desulfobacterales bacterium]|nr:BREX system ATP-binding protein BrxD [Desulfobacterales bacterium]